MRTYPQFPSAAGAVFALLTFGSAPTAAQTDSSASTSHRTAKADTLEAPIYEGWKHYRLVCDRCHGEDARGTTFGPDLLPAFRPGGAASSLEAFKALLLTGRPDRGMPPATKLGLSPDDFDGLHGYLQGRSSGKFVGGRPARRE